MTKITIKSDCGNSPKKQFLKDINIAFANGDIDFLSHCVTADIHWNIIGDKTIQGLDQYIDELEIMKSNKVSELILDRILSHGKEGAVNGTMKMENGKMYGFADFYAFSGAKGTKIKSITSYIIQISKEASS